MKKELPKSWCVLNDGSPEFQVVIKYMDDHDEIKWSVQHYDLAYCGVDEDGDFMMGHRKRFETLLTLQEFIDLTTPDTAQEEKKKYEPQPVPKCTKCGRSNKDCCCKKRRTLMSAAKTIVSKRNYMFKLEDIIKTPLPTAIEEEEPVFHPNHVAEIAQWVIDNRYSKGENYKVSDFEMYQEICERIRSLFFTPVDPSKPLPVASPSAEVVLNKTGVHYVIHNDIRTVTTKSALEAMEEYARQYIGK